MFVDDLETFAADLPPGLHLLGVLDAYCHALPPTVRARAIALYDLLCAVPDESLKALGDAVAADRTHPRSIAINTAFLLLGRLHDLGIPPFDHRALEIERDPAPDWFSVPAGLQFLIPVAERYWPLFAESQAHDAAAAVPDADAANLLALANRAQSAPSHALFDAWRRRFDRAPAGEREALNRLENASYFLWVFGTGRPGFHPE